MQEISNKYPESLYLVSVQWLMTLRVVAMFDEVSIFS